MNELTSFLLIQTPAIVVMGVAIWGLYNLYKGERKENRRLFDKLLSYAENSMKLYTVVNAVMDKLLDKGKHSHEILAKDILNMKNELKTAIKSLTDAVNESKKTGR